MSALILDAGALVAVDRDDRAMIARLQRDGRDAGVLQAMAGTAAAIDATVVLLAVPGDRILTSDPGDINLLAAAAENRAVVVSC